MQQRILAKRLPGKRWQIEAKVIRETAKAVMVTNGATDVWLPRSQYFGRAPDSGQLIVSDWILNQKCASFDMIDPDNVADREALAEQRYRENRRFSPPRDYWGPDDDY